MITFNEIQTPGYPARTAHNVCSSDLTIALAVDFTTAGEVLTKKLCKENNKPYLPIKITDDFLDAERIEKVNAWLKNNAPNPAVINFAGNGIYTLPKNEEFYYEWVYRFFAAFKFKAKIISGGQTGIDEIVIVVANFLGYACEVNAPKGWMFKTKEVTISDEKLFKERFLT